MAIIQGTNGNDILTGGNDDGLSVLLMMTSRADSQSSNVNIKGVSAIEILI